MQSLTLYPVPFGMTEADTTELLTNELKNGEVVQVKQGTHNLLKHIRNGFIHIKTQDINMERLPDHVLINNRIVTILKPGQNLTRPCGVSGKVRPSKRLSIPTRLCTTETKLIQYLLR